MADVDRLEEMHTQRMESLDDMSGHNRTLAAQMVGSNSFLPYMLL